MQQRPHKSGSAFRILLLLIVAAASASPARPIRAGGDLALLLAAPPPSRAPAYRAPLRNEKLAAGRLLVATPRLSGPIFGRTVILLLDYDSTGAMGVILNRPSSVSLSEIFPNVPDLATRKDRVFVGGPVAPSSMAFLIRGDKKPPASHHLIDDIHMSGSALALEHVVESNTPAERFHAFVGYSGWAPLQLDGEVERGDWWVVPGKPELIFDVAPDELWQKMISTYGGVQVKSGRAQERQGAG